jgi:hypothetical protein
MGEPSFPIMRGPSAPSARPGRAARRAPSSGGPYQADALKALDDLVRYYRSNEQRMRYRLFRESGFPIGRGAAESAHRNVLQVRMKRAGQRWNLKNARKMAQLRAAYRTAGALDFYGAIQRARRRTTEQPEQRSRNFRSARQGRRDLERCERNRRSN